MHKFSPRFIFLFGISFFFFFLGLFMPSFFLAQSCITIPYQPTVNVNDLNVCTNSGFSPYAAPGYAFDQNCNQEPFACEIVDSCTKYTGTQCCTINPAGGLHYDYCQQTSVTGPVGSMYTYTIQCCFNPTPTPTPVPPTPTNTPVPPTPTNTPVPPTPIPPTPTPTPSTPWCNSSLVGGNFCADSRGSGMYSYCLDSSTYYKVSCNTTNPLDPFCMYGSPLSCVSPSACQEIPLHYPQCVAPTPTPTPT